MSEAANPAETPESGLPPEVPAASEERAEQEVAALQSPSDGLATPAEEETATGADEESPEQDDAAQRAESAREFYEKRRETKAQRLDREIEEKEQRLEALRARESQTSASPAPETFDDLREPQLSDPDIDYDEDKLHAKRVKLEVAREMRQLRREQVLEREKGRQTAAESEFDRAAETYAEKNPDYKDLVQRSIDAGLKPSPALSVAILSSPDGPALHYRLVSDPALTQRLNGLSDLAAVMELGRIAAAESSPEKKSPAPKPQTRAPKPIESPVGSGGAAGGGSLDLNELGISAKEHQRRKAAIWDRDHPRE